MEHAPGVFRWDNRFPVHKSLFSDLIIVRDWGKGYPSDTTLRFSVEISRAESELENASLRFIESIEPPYGMLAIPKWLEQCRVLPKGNGAC